MTTLNEVFDSVRHSAFRLEARRRYTADEEVEPFRRFLANEPDDLTWHRPWLDRIRAATAAGITYRRVRLLDDPPTDYQRWGIQLSEINGQAGEQIRFLDRAEAERLGVPVDGDWWLIDDRVVLMRYDSDDQLVTLDVVDQAHTIAEHSRWRDLLWSATVSSRYVHQHAN